MRFDYVAKKWDCYVGTVLVAADLPFRIGSASYFSWFGIKGHATGITRLDSIYIGVDNALFLDADNDGLDDSWEIANGLNPEHNDRSADSDGDGISNIRELLLSTKPNSYDTDADGLSDGQELAVGSNPILQDTDGDGMPDGWEVQNGFNLNSNDGEGDADGDGISNRVEYQTQTSPLDYYNGFLPQITSLLSEDGTLATDGTLQVLVSNSAGQPLVNAPVIFRAKSGGHRLSANLNVSDAIEVTVRSDSNGIARVYIQQ